MQQYKVHWEARRNGMNEATGQDEAGKLIAHGDSIQQAADDVEMQQKIDTILKPMLKKTFPQEATADIDFSVTFAKYEFPQRKECEGCGG